MDKERLSGYFNQTIDKNKIRAGDHIYIHEKRGLTNKHGIAVFMSMVVFYDTRNKSIVKKSLSEFAGCNIIRLALYEQPRLKNMFKRKGTSFEKKSMPPKVVVNSAEYFNSNPDEWIETHSLNESEEFARHCKEATTKAIPVVESCLKPGDHICVRKCCPLPGSDAVYLYTHHGIYIGKKEVVHFSGEQTSSKKTAKIRRDSLEVFSTKAKNLYRYGRTHMFVNVSEILPVHRRDSNEIVKQAIYYADNSDMWPHYDLFRNNCEFFALQVTFGGQLCVKLFQHQIKRLVSVFYFATSNIYSILKFLSDSVYVLQEMTAGTIPKERVLQKLLSILMEASEAIVNKKIAQQLNEFIEKVGAGTIPNATDLISCISSLPPLP